MSRILYESLLIALVPLLLLSGCRGSTENAAPDIELTPAELNWIGSQIFRNECAGREACLVHWNEGEAFPSLGIGHFIWYPANVRGRFVESFPALVSFMRERSVPLPRWLNELEPFDAPWPDREAFRKAEDSERVVLLREFLSSTRGVQAEFIVRRARTALADLVDAAPAARQAELRSHLRQLTGTPGGAYAVIDYVNFKGEGLSAQETYQGYGWGLLQVLLAMPDTGGTTLERFRRAAKDTLTRRAEHASQDIEREKWLPGWLARIDTYREPG